MIRTNVRFKSAAFVEQEHEAGHVHPGRFGSELAIWLRERLEECELMVSEPTPEDWGWVLIVRHTNRSFFLGCGNVDGEDQRWLVFAEPPPVGFFDRLWGGGDEAAEAVTLDLCRTIDAALRSEPSISDIEWFATDDEGQELEHAEHPD